MKLIFPRTLKLLKEQYVCKSCGYNLIGYYPEFCPFCGASYVNFITAEECSQKYSIVSTKINNKIDRLNSYPKLGLEHSAYCIKIKSKNFWIDSPSTFSKDLELMDKILFTHHHFLGASNLYRAYYTTFIWIHKKDSEHPIASKHPFDKKFEHDFNIEGIESHIINGHTPGFTFYIFEDVLFICDYFFLKKERLILNPYGPAHSTMKGLKKIKEILRNRNIKTVCGYNYVLDYNNWNKKLLILDNDSNATKM